MSQEKTEPSPYFTPDDLRAFARDGFVIERAMYSPAEVAAISGWIDELAARPPARGREMVYLEDSLLQPGRRVLSRIEKFADHHQALHDLVYDARVAGRAGELLGAPAILFKEKVNFKVSGGGGFEPHQDIQPGWDDYAPYFISVLITIDDSSVANGCLELAAGHHRRGMIGERWQPLSAAQLEGMEFVAYPTAPGDTVFFDCFVPHRSAPNMTATARRNVYVTYNRLADGDWREKYFADKRSSYPPDNEREEGKEYRFRV